MKRFFFVASRTCNRAHMVAAPAHRKNPVEGDLTYCGRIVSTAWRNLSSRFRGLRKGPIEVCSQCEARMPARINVARVR